MEMSEKGGMKGEEEERDQGRAIKQWRLFDRLTSFLSKGMCGKLLWTPSDIVKLLQVDVCCLKLKPADITY